MLNYALLSVVFLLTPVLRAAPACAPFRAHFQVQLPPPPDITTPIPLPNGWEGQLINAIASVDTESSFAKIYQNFLDSKQESLSDDERFQWLSCISYYTNLNRFDPLAPKWTAIVDNHPSRIIYPVNIDKEMGFNDQVHHSIPAYLRIPASRQTAAWYQKKLFKDYGVLAIDHTDKHSAVVLKELIFLLKNGIGKKLVQSLPSLHYVYAFSGHDSQTEIAAYHHQVKAISVGGILSYPKKALDKDRRIALLAALAHEIGHAFVFDHINAKELKEIATTYGHWQTDPKTLDPSSLYSSIFFKPLEKNDLLTETENSTNPSTFFGLSSQLENLTTQYAAKNIHEWFADAFAANILMDLGEAGFLGPSWKSSLVKYPDHSSYWTNYNNLTPEFRAWLNHKIGDILNPGSTKNAHLRILAHHPQQTKS